MITRESIKALRDTSDDLRAQKELASELLRTAQDRFGHQEVEIERDGKTIALTEKVLWEEVFLMGTSCQAGTILKKAHPEVFEAFEDQDRKAGKLKEISVKELGVDYTQMTLSDYVALMEGMFALLLSERDSQDK